VQAGLPTSKPSVIIGIIVLVIGLLLFYLRATATGATMDVEVSYIGSILVVGLAMVFV
jgi:hypothetical protein